jgi:serine/threonine protein kinase/outer membrane biosynthesis protein TonB
MAITSTESFLALLEKSQLLGAKDLEKVRGVAGKYEDPKALARALVAAKGLTRWQAGQLLAGRSSFTLGKYRLVDLLGRGGMGSVFAAEHKTLGRRVALKIISKQTGRDPEQLERFLDEARRIAALDHPNIVRAFDVDHEGERYFLVLERVEGRDLQQMVESDGPLDVGRAARFTRDAALGLAHAHDRKMIHCDIKPANLIVGNEDVVKILDMGMARLVESDGSSSDSNENIVGTIDYIAPEQALEAEDLDHRADIYSLGCTLYFLLTSRPPFGDGTLAQRIMKHQTQTPRPISDTRSGVPDELAAVCSKMMAKKPEDRFQNAADVARALETWAAGDAKAGPRVDAPVASSGPAVVELIDDEPPTAKDDGEVSISVTDSGSFSKRGGSSRGRRPSPVQKTDVDEPALVEPIGFFDDPRKKWATIIGAGLLVIATVGGGLVWSLGGGKATPDAPTEKTLASAEATPATPVAPASESELELDDSVDLDSMFGGGEKSSDNEETPAEKELPSSAPGESEKPAEPEGDTTPAIPAAEKPPAPKTDAPAPKVDKPKPKEAPKEPAREESKKEEPKKEETKKAEPKKAPKVQPFKDFPKAASIPILSDNDPIGEASKAPLTLAAVRGPTDVNWQMLLVGGDKVLKGGRTFVLARTETDTAKAAWSIDLSGSSSGGQEKIARVWRQGENLRFQWNDEAPGASANYLRNCFLQVRVSGESRYLALTEPVQAEPIQLDLLRGQSNASVGIKSAPDNDMLRFKFTGVEGIKKVRFDPAEPVAPKTQVAVHFVYTDRYENDINAVTFGILTTARRSSLSLTMRSADSPEVKMFFQSLGNYNEQQIGVRIDQLGNQRTDLQRKLQQAQGGEKHKFTQEIDALSRQIWYAEFFLKAHKKAALHYQVVADVGGQELVLVSTK